MAQKQCTRCGLGKSENEFAIRKDRGTRYSRCIPCEREARKETSKRYYVRNVESCRTKAKEYRRTHDTYRGYAALKPYIYAWRERHPERYRDSQARRRAQIEVVDSKTVNSMTILARDPCSYCGDRNNHSIDHIEPLADGGNHHWTNLTSACRRCNSVKGSRSLLETLLNGSG